MNKFELNHKTYHLEDGMGSIVGLADNSGVEVAEFEYDSFGNLRSGATGMPNELGGDFRFQGQWLESNTDFYHFRARYYDPETGRFVSRDPIDVIETEPESSNPYQFVYNNPHVYSDPTGLFTITELNAAQTIQKHLATSRRYAINESKEYVKERLGESIGNMINNVFMSFLPGKSFADDLNDLLRSDTPSLGDVFSFEVTDIFCSIFDGAPLANMLRLEVGIHNQTGEPQHPGYGCDSHSNPPSRSREKNISRPDFLFIDGNPMDKILKNPKSYLIGDFKLSEGRVKDAILDTYPQGNRQWLAMARYATTYQLLPIVSYITFLEAVPGFLKDGKIDKGVSKTDRAKMAKMAKRRGVILLTATLFN